MKPRIAAALTLILAASAALAARPRAFVHQAESDFTAGKFDNVIVDSYGQLKLGRAISEVALPKPADHIIGFAAAADGTVFCSTSEGVVYRLTGSKVELAYTSPKSVVMATTIAVAANGDVLLGVTGEEDAKILRIDTKADKLLGKVIATPKGADTIWTIRTGADGAIYASTGGEKGAVHKLVEGNKTEVVFETESRNITALSFDSKGHILAGTDAGLILRIDKDSKKPYVLHDAGGVDVNAIVTDNAGNIYVATAMGDGLGLGGGGGGGGLDEMNGDKSKPSKVEPDEPAAPDEEPTPKNKSGAAIQLSPGIHADLVKDVPADIKSLLHKLEKSDNKKGRDHDGPTTKKTPPKNKNKSGGKPRRNMPDISDDLGEGASAVYRIAADGNVTTLIDEADMNYCLLLSGNELLIGTGNEGKLFAYNINDESFALIGRLNDETITALQPTKDGIYLATANAGHVYTLGATLAKSGTFTSDVLDARNTATFGPPRVTAETPAGASIKTEVRTGNTRDVETHEKLWSDWAEVTAQKPPANARFIQYRITLTGDGKDASPAITNVRLSYTTQNQAPRLRHVTVETEQSMDALGGEETSALAHSDHIETPTGNVSINWEGTDPNDDDLTYRVMYRQVNAKGEPVWTTLAKDLKETTFDWQTRTIPDGKYQVKVIASDAADNAAESAKSTARDSAVFTIDHTGPDIADITTAVEGNKVKLTGSTTDALSNIADIRFQVDNQGDWQPAAASDKMFDSPSEAFTATTKSLAAGNHRITIRVTDAAGNSSYKAVTVTIK